MGGRYDGYDESVNPVMIRTYDYLIDRPKDYYLAPERFSRRGRAFWTTRRKRAGPIFRTTATGSPAQSWTTTRNSREMSVPSSAARRTPGFRARLPPRRIRGRQGDRERHERIWYDSEGSERSRSKPRSRSARPGCRPEARRRASCSRRASRSMRRY